MIQGYWRKVRDEWRAKRRLRLAGMVALAFVALHALSALEQHRQSLASRYGNDLELQARLEGMRGQAHWKERAAQAEAALDDMRARVPEVSGAGLAQAELQNWLAELAARTALSDSRVRIEQTLDVPDYPDMWQVMGRLDGQVPEFGEALFLRTLSGGLPWIQAERLEIAPGKPARVTLVVRAYYRRAATPAGGAADARAAGVAAPAPVPGSSQGGNP